MVHLIEQPMWKKLKRWYLIRCPAKDEASRRKSFSCLQYQSEVRVEQQLLRDSVREMMHLAQFQAWAAKGKNVPPKGLSPIEAATEFSERHKDPECIVDYLGPTEDYRLRIAVLTKTTVSAMLALGNRQ